MRVCFVCATYAVCYGLLGCVYSFWFYTFHLFVFFEVLLTCFTIIGEYLHFFCHVRTLFHALIFRFFAQLNLLGSVSLGYKSLFCYHKVDILWVMSLTALNNL